MIAQHPQPTQAPTDTAKLDLVPKQAKALSVKTFSDFSRMTWYHFPDGVEVVLTPAMEPKPARVDESDESRKPSAQETRENTHHAYRAAAMVRRRCRTAALNILWTFTFPGQGIHDYSKAAVLFERWLHDYGHHFFHSVYIAVPELHPGGHGWHWHLVTRHRPRVEEVRASWTRFLTNRGMPPSGGARWVMVNVQRTKSIRKTARYVAKYITKTLGTAIPKGSKRYRVGTSTDKPFRRSPVYVNQPLETLYNRLKIKLTTSRFAPRLSCYASWTRDDWEPPPYAVLEW